MGSRFHVVAVAPDRDAEPVRTFQSFTQDLHRLADWLKTVGITTVAMESTGVYWIPAFEILEAQGFEVLLVNARDVKECDPQCKTSYAVEPTCSFGSGTESGAFGFRFSLSILATVVSSGNA